MVASSRKSGGSSSTRIDSEGNIISSTAVRSEKTSSPQTHDVISNTTMFSSTIDTFGFNLTRQQFAIVAILTLLMMGLPGLFLFGMGMMAYQGYQRFANQSSSSRSSSSGGSRPGWGAPGGIRGISDLPCDPTRG